MSTQMTTQMTSKDWAETKKYNKVMAQFTAYAAAAYDRVSGGEKFLCYACNSKKDLYPDMICKRCVFDQQYREGGFRKVW